MTFRFNNNNVVYCQSVTVSVTKYHDTVVQLERCLAEKCGQLSKGDIARHNSLKLFEEVFVSERLTAADKRAWTG